MNTNTSLKRSPLQFFVLVFALSLLIWLLGPLAEHFSLELPAIPFGGASQLSVDVIVGDFCPLIAAFILVYREEKRGGISRFLKRVFDLKRIRHKIWYVPIIFLYPLIYVLTYGVMLFLGRPLPAPSIPLLLLPILFVAFFLEAVGEEGGWTGYATDPLQDRWGALKAGFLLGLVWAIWHLIPAIQDHETLTFIAWHSLDFVAGRILYVWLYNKTGKCLFATIVFHDMANVGYVLFPVHGSLYDPAIGGSITAVIAVIVTFLWGTKTLARYRYAVRGTSPSGAQIQGGQSH